MKTIEVLMTGGTIAQTIDDSGRMHIAKSVDDLVANIESDADISTHSFGARTGANLTFQTALEIQQHILKYRETFDGFVLITGTDSMEELAFFLDCTLKLNSPIVLTGSMKPSDIIGYDGLSNLQQAIQVCCNGKTEGRGILVVLNDDIHLARHVRKHDSQLIGAFHSHPGPVGQIRKGEVIYYFDNHQSELYYDVSHLNDITANIPTLIFTMGMSLPRGLLPDCDGLIIAGMGTSSIPNTWIEELSHRWTSKFPIVLVSRCAVGTNYDDCYYRGSLEKYENKGFLIKGFEELNAMQARIKLLLEISCTP